MDKAAATAAKAYADFALTAALRSARTYERYVQVVGCLARGQTSVEETTTRIAQAADSHLHNLSPSLTDLYGQLFTSLVSEHYLPPGGEHESSADSDETSSWAESLARQSAERDAAVVGELVEQLHKVATAELTAKEVLREAKTFFRTAPAARLSDAAEAWFGFLAGLETIRADLGNHCLEAVLDNIVPGAVDGDVLKLNAPAGSTANASLCIDNDHETPVDVYCSVSELRRADGINAAFPAAAEISPEQFTLAAGASCNLSVTVHLDADVYRSDTAYVGVLHIMRDQHTRTDIPLRITASSTPA